MVSLSVKSAFFDSAKVVKSLNKDERQRLSKIGAFLRRTHKGLIRYRKSASAPGQPPSAHRSDQFNKKSVNRKTGAVKAQPASPFRELIYFAYDAARRSVVEGAVRFAKGEAPRLNEFGGTITRTRVVRVKSSRRKAYSRAQAQAYRQKILSGQITVQAAPTTTVTKTAHYPKRPSARPALDKEIAKGTIPALWRNAIKST